MRIHTSDRMVTYISDPRLEFAAAQKLGKIPLVFFQALDVPRSHDIGFGGKPAAAVHLD